MKILLLITVFTLLTNSPKELPKGWRKIETSIINKEEFEIFFFDYMTRIVSTNPNILELKGRQFLNALEDVRFMYPSYVAKQLLPGQDSIIFYVLRPNEEKRKTMFHLDFEVIKVAKDFQIEKLELKENYKRYIIKSMLAEGCRAGSVCEYNSIIQQHPDKEKLIGNGFQIADSIFTRVIPYDEQKKSFYKIIERNME